MALRLVSAAERHRHSGLSPDPRARRPRAGVQTAARATRRRSSSRSCRRSPTAPPRTHSQRARSRRDRAARRRASTTSRSRWARSTTRSTSTGACSTLRAAQPDARHGLRRHGRPVPRVRRRHVREGPDASRHFGLGRRRPGGGARGGTRGRWRSSAATSFLDPWGTRCRSSPTPRFSSRRRPRSCGDMGLELEKSESALRELQDKGLT